MSFYSLPFSPNFVASFVGLCYSSPRSQNFVASFVASFVALCYFLPSALNFVATKGGGQPTFSRFS